jgi:hypothetical protein
MSVASGSNVACTRNSNKGHATILEQNNSAKPPNEDLTDCDTAAGSDNKHHTNATDLPTGPIPSYLRTLCVDSQHIPNEITVRKPNGIILYFCGITKIKGAPFPYRAQWGPLQCHLLRNILPHIQQTVRKTDAAAGDLLTDFAEMEKFVTSICAYSTKHYVLCNYDPLFCNDTQSSIPVDDKRNVISRVLCNVFSELTDSIRGEISETRECLPVLIFGRQYREIIEYIRHTKRKALNNVLLFYASGPNLELHPKCSQSKYQQSQVTTTIKDFMNVYSFVSIVNKRISR